MGCTLRHAEQRVNYLFRLTEKKIGRRILPMNFKDTIADLIGLGFTQTAIAAECGCAKSTINELKTGVTTMPSFDIGYKLAEMHKKAVAADRRKKAKEPS